MIRFSDALKVHDDKKQPYSITVIKEDAYDHLNGLVSDRGYELTYMGSRYELNMPQVADFSLEFSFCHKTSFCKGCDEHFGVYFGYTEAMREGYELDIVHLDNGGSAVRLSAMKARERILIKEDTFEFTQKPDEIYKVKLSVRDGHVNVFFGKHHFQAQIEAGKGRVGFWKGRGFREIILSDMKFSSLECKSISRVQKRVMEIPTDNGMTLPYTLEIRKTLYPDNICRIDYVFDGGLAKRTSNGVLHGVSCCWTGMRDIFTAPYFKLNGGKRIYIDNNKICILQDDLTIPTEKNTVASQIEQTYNIYRAVSNVVTLPLKGSYMMQNVDINEISFGYERFIAFGTEFQSGKREFVFNKKGKLIYSGMPLDTETFVRVSSPLNEDLAGQVPKNVLDRDKVIQHFEKNHYFYDDQQPKFTAEVLTDLDASLITVKAFLMDAFLRKQKEIPTTRVLKPRVKFGKNCIVSEYLLDALAEGVYHISFEVYYCGSLKEEHHSAFTVMDKKSDTTPQEASGLPTVHTGDGGPAELQVCTPNPRGTLDDFNIEHYIDKTLIQPYNFSGKNIAELLSLIKKKTMVWATWRTARPEELYDGQCLELDTLQNADYINYFWPAIIHGYASRCDLFAHACFVDEVLDAVYDFINEKTAPDEILRKKDVRKDFTIDDHRYFMKKYAPDFLEYFHPIMRKMYAEQWAEVKKANPKAKRFAYGPWNVYVSPHMGGYSAKWFGGDPTKWSEMYDGFLQLEDYPFCCGYHTTRGAWAVMTTKYLSPTMRVHPEVYDSWEEGCPDGAIPPAHPPLGNACCPPYFGITQVYEYLYNSVFMDENGKFRYWRDYGLILFAPYMRNPQLRMDTFLPGWGAAMDNKPAEQKKSAIFIYDNDKADDRYDYENNDHAFFNISDANETYIYRQLRESGLPAGYVTGFNALHHISKDTCDVLVLPSLKNISDKTAKQLRKLHTEGVCLFATSHVGPLADLFGVKENHRFSMTRRIVSGKEVEQVLPLEAEYFYDAIEGDVLLASDQGDPVLVQNGRCVLLNAPICQVGANYAIVDVNNTPENISVLLKTTVRNVLKTLSSPLYTVNEQCGITAFKNEKGEDMLLLIDYTDYDHDAVFTRNTILTVNINEKGFKGAEVVSSIPKEVGIHTKNGHMDALTLTIKPQESVLLKLIK